MDVRGPIPFHATVQAARAYGVRAAAPTAHASRPAPLTAAPSAAAPQAPIASQPAANANRLVAARVAVSADPTNAPTATPTAGAFAMYTRAADRIEVATSVALGRSVDRLA